MIWWILIVVSIVALIVHWRGPNAVWGTATFGLLIGIALAIVQPGFVWWTVVKTVVIAIFIGIAFEWLPRLARFNKSEPNTVLANDQRSYIRVYWRDAPANMPAETWSELDGERNEIRNVQIWADGRVGYASQHEEVGGSRLSRGGIPTLETIFHWGDCEAETVSAFDFEQRWREAATQ